MSKITIDKVVLKKALENKQNIVLEYNSLRKAVLTVRALDHEMRKEIIKILDKTKSITVTDLYTNLGVEQSVASQHLAVLRRSGIVKTGKTGKYVHYSINEARLEEVNELVKNLAENKS
jgi:ArsR family transcriptional regulator, virulence genes transcriptional regulator